MNNPNWVQAHRSLAERLLAGRANMTGLVDALSWALEACCMQFPIAEAGEQLDALDPFTFMAAWCRPMPEARKERLFALVCEALDLSVEAPSFVDCPEVEDYRARMFSHREKTMAAEIERLWDLFAAAVGLAGGETPVGRAAFVRAYDDVLCSKAPARACLTTLLCWVDPWRFPLLDEVPPTGEAYLAACAGGVADRGLPRVQEPRIDPEATEGLVREFLGSLVGQGPAGAPASARAATGFARRWDLSAVDFSAMFAGCLEAAAPLLDGGAARELRVFAEREPHALAQALRCLFGQERPLEERVAPFVDTCAALFERHRGAVCSAVARPSASANYRTAAALLFLHDPARCHPFSPRKLQALDRRCGFGCRYRIARPECVAHYFDLAGQVADLLARDGLGEKVCAGLGIDGVEGLSARGRLTVAVDELARFAVTAG